MYSLVLLGFSSVLLAFLATPVVTAFCQRIGLVDQPDKIRKLHLNPVPRLGGLAILFAYLGSFGVLWLADLKAMLLVRQGIILVLDLAPAIVLILVVGFLDDVIGLTPWQKIVGQVVAVYIAMQAGIWVEKLFSTPVYGVASMAVTLIWLLGCTNAFNLIDGLDGLAAGVGLFASLTILVGALLQKNMSLALATMPLAGALIGFLWYNFTPARIFLGDGGSLTIGFVLGCFGVVWQQKGTTALGMTAPIMALSLPLLDMGLAMTRRFLRQQPIFAADRGHIHHRLLDRGLSSRKAVLLLYLACGVAATFSLILATINRTFGGVVVVMFCVVAGVALYKLGFDEIAAFSDLFLTGKFRQVIKIQVTLREIERDLSRICDPDELWKAVQAGCLRLGFECVHLRFMSQAYSKEATSAGFPDAASAGNSTERSTVIYSRGANPGEGQWTLNVPITEGDFLVLQGSMSATGPTTLTEGGTTLASMLARVLARKHREMTASLTVVTG